MTVGFTVVREVNVSTVIVITDLDIVVLMDQTDAATTLAPFITQGSHSLSAVAPDHTLKGGLSAWAFA